MVINFFIILINGKDIMLFDASCHDVIDFALLFILVTLGINISPLVFKFIIPVESYQTFSNKEPLSPFLTLFYLQSESFILKIPLLY